MGAEKKLSLRRRFSVWLEDHETFAVWNYVLLVVCGLALLFFIGTFFLNTVFRYQDNLAPIPLSELF